jgi:ferrochelatase
MASAKIGIILAQLGTPEAPTPPALRRYLREFLSDPRVLELPPLRRWLLLNLVILPRRPQKSAALYRRIWTERGSPLLLNTREQAEKLEEALGGIASVTAGMRYGSPSIASAIDELVRGGAGRLLVFSMYPQYAGATWGSTCDAVFAALAGRRSVPALRFVPPYPVDPAYIGALAAAAREEFARLPWQPDRVVFSFHGLPRRFIARGEVYEEQARATAGLLAEALELSPADYVLTFQSRFGREEWLQPYTDETLRRLAAGGFLRVAVICPGFTADCLETLDEIGNEGRKVFLEAGGKELRLLPCLNAHPAWIEAMAAIARRELSGWIPAEEGAAQSLAGRMERA